MRRSLHSTIVLCTVFLGSSALLYAQGAEFSLGGGLGIPLGTYNDVAKIGWQGTAGIAFVGKTAPVGVRVDGSYAQFSDETTLDIKSQLIYGTANVVYRLGGSTESRVRPYLVGGGGVYNLKAIGDDAFEGSSTDFGVNLGAGLDVGAGGAGIFVEARWHNIFLEGANLKLIPITLGLRFGGG
jgi:hypothetical protein